MRGKKAPEPDTQIGRLIKAKLDRPTAVVNRQARRAAREVLRETKPKGKPN